MRAFLAIPLPGGFLPVLESLQENLRRLAALNEFRWIPGENVHLTLRFLGEIGEEQAAGAGRALEEAAGGVAPFELRFERFGVFPHLKNPNVLWVGPNQCPEPLVAFAAKLADGLEGAGFSPEKRLFRPHLTMARRRVRRRPPSGLEGELEAAERRWLQPAPSFRAAEACLFCSELRPSGAIYTPLNRVSLDREVPPSARG